MINQTIFPLQAVQSTTSKTTLILSLVILVFIIYKYRMYVKKKLKTE